MTRQRQGEELRSAACARSLGAQLRECAPAVGGHSPPAWRSVAGGRCVSAHLFQKPPLHLQNLLRPGPVVGHVRHYPAPPSRTVTCCREGGKAGESGAVVGGGRGGTKKQVSRPPTRGRAGHPPRSPQRAAWQRPHAGAQHPRAGGEWAHQQCGQPEQLSRSRRRPRRRAAGRQARPAGSRDALARCETSPCVLAGVGKRVQQQLTRGPC